MPASIGCLPAAIATPPAAAAQEITHRATTERMNCARRQEATGFAASRLRGGERPAVLTSLSDRFALSSKQPVLLRQPEQGSRPRFLQLPFLAAGIAGGSDFCSSRQSARTLFGAARESPAPALRPQPKKPMQMGPSPYKEAPLSLPTPP